MIEREVWRMVHATLAALPENERALGLGMSGERCAIQKVAPVILASHAPAGEFIETILGLKVINQIVSLNDGFRPGVDSPGACRARYEYMVRETARRVAGDEEGAK